MVRNELCPLCGSATEPLLHLQFSAKMGLPADVGIRYCASENFLFVAAGSSSAYDEYYRSLANDSYHAELSPDNLHSPIAQLQRRNLSAALGSYLDKKRKVLDFGCGEAALLVELAAEFPPSTFIGFDPSPGAQIGTKKADLLGLKNLRIASFAEISDAGPYDLIIVSHVLEHLLDFGLLDLLNTLLTDTGLLYVEVPNALQYEHYRRREFLYYFDRLHLNHFTPQSLARLTANHGFQFVERLEYAFPYRDGEQYPALGILFRRGKQIAAVSSPSVMEAAERYISAEKQRAKVIAAGFDSYPSVLVWGAGDNFYRAMSNNGPLSQLQHIVVLDSRAQEITIENRKFTTASPAKGIQCNPWPVIITISANHQAISDQVHEIDPNRPVFFV